MTVKEIKESILKLKPIERMHMMDEIINSIKKPDPEIEHAWALESERRLKSYKEGKAKAIRWETVKKRLFA